VAFNAGVLGLTPIQRRSKGDNVLSWQRFLRDRKFSVGTPDGDFGPATEAATKLYQTQNKLASTGIVDVATYQLAMQQNFIFYVANLTASRLLQALNFGIDEVKDLQKVLTVNGKLIPALVQDGAFGANSTRGMVEVYKRLEAGFAPALTAGLSAKTKTKLGADLNPAIAILTEFSRRLRVRLSGKAWVEFKRASTSLEDLSFPFRDSAKAFAKAMVEAGATIEIANTLRPPERVHLMHYSYKVSEQMLAPQDVPPCPGVDIDWVHYTPALSIKAAEEMVDAYEIAYAPALYSNHTIGRAVDWWIEWKKPIRVKDIDGNLVDIDQPRNSNDNQDLWDLGEGYGVYKLPADPPHWSYNGY
jgi:peptidoglycan hydrolase-like protein with peptidoglycan-binding domain